MSDSFQARFITLWDIFASKRLRLSPTLQSSIGATLLTAYSEPHRAYHTTQHIVECIELLELIRDQLLDPLGVELAIWFHDAVYDTKTSTNEEDSAQLMQDILEQCDPINIDLARIKEWVIATKTHSISDPTQEYISDLQYLLDIDLSILGADPDRFVQYDNQIRQEYNWVPERDFLTKRKSIINDLVTQNNNMYFTQFCQTRFEARAKANCARLETEYTARLAALTNDD